LWNTLTTVNKTSTCPGECVHAITSIFCDNVIEEISCGGHLSRCCISNSQYYQIFGHLPSNGNSDVISDPSTESPTTTTTETFSVISNNHYQTTTTTRFNYDNPEQQQQNSSIKTNPCPVQCQSIRNQFCMRPLHDAYCMNTDEECCLENESTLDQMTKNFIKLIKQTVAMNQTKNIGAEFQQHSSLPLITTTTTTTPTTTLSSLQPCDGTCVVPLFHMLCDEIDHNQYCAHGYCCVNREINPTPLPPPISTCDGTCLPIILSGMCTKPSELVLKTLDCGTGTICCARGKIEQQDMINNQQQLMPGYPNQLPPRLQLPFSIRKNNQSPPPTMET
ncbi:serine protease Masquerade-like protein, partial [Euroglyphus maynei]